MSTPASPDGASANGSGPAGPATPPEAPRGPGRAARLRTDVRRRRAATKGRSRRMRSVLSLLRPHRRRVALLGLAIVVATASTLLPPLLAKYAVDDGLRAGDTGRLTELVVLLIVVSLVGLVASMAVDRGVGWLGARVLADLRMRIFNHLLALPVGFHERQRAGVLVSRMTNDVDALQTMISDSLVTLVRALLMLAGSIVLLLVLDVRLALITFLTIPVLLIGSLVFRIASVDAFARTRVTIGIITAHLQETLSGVRVIRSYGREDGHVRQFRTLNDDNRDANMKTVYLNAAYFPAVEYLSTIAIVIVLLVGGGSAIEGTVTIGVLIGFVTALDNFFGPITDLSNVYTTFQSGMAALDKIGGLLDEESDLTDPERPKPLAEPVRGSVRFEDVSFAYAPGLPPVLHDVDLEVPAGTTLALVGPTGAGKSTVVKLAARFVDPVAGSITFDGTDLRELRQGDLRGRMGIVPQEGFLFSGSIAENVAFGRADATREEVEDAVRAVGADAMLEALPQGLDTPVGERGGSLSAGQRQLVAFARALVADPRLLLLDEATANVDLRTERRIEQALGTLLSGRTAIVIAHRLSTIRSADRIAVVDEGRIVESGTHDELVALGGAYAALNDDWEGRVAA